MSVSDVLALISDRNPTLDRHLERLPAKQKKTAKVLLESIVRLAYVLWATGDEKSTASIVNAVAEIPFTKNQDYWTWIEGAIILKGSLAKQHGSEDVYLKALACANAALITGDQLADEINAEVHAEFLDGEMLSADFANASDIVDEFDMRIVYLMDMLKIAFFGGSDNWPLSEISVQLRETSNKMNQIVMDLGLYNLPPYK